MGIGEAVALALAKEGVNLALLSRSKVGHNPTRLSAHLVLTKSG
jgi:short-subunit dehydrogenase